MRLIKDVEAGVADVQMVLGVVDDGLPVGVAGIANEWCVIDDSICELR